MIRYSKYHGLGNDFVFAQYKDVENYDLQKLAKILCNRHTGIGADGFIIVKENPLEMIYYNSDGSRAEMCGNGIRCFAKYVFDNHIVEDTSYEIVTLAGIYKMNVQQTNPFICEVNMGKESYQPSDFFVNSDDFIKNMEFSYKEDKITASSLLLGVPHTLVEVDFFDQEEMRQKGAFLEKHPFYKEGTNVNFYKVLNPSHIKMQTFERGAGLTLACGTGACAVFASLNNDKRISHQAVVSLPLGNLTIRRESGSIYMSGPAVKVFDVEFEMSEIYE